MKFFKPEVTLGLALVAGGLAWMYGPIWLIVGGGALIALAVLTR